MSQFRLATGSQTFYQKYIQKTTDVFVVLLLLLLLLKVPTLAKAHICLPNIRKVKSSGLEFKASLGYIA